jgi:hypothetical protein
LTICVPADSSTISYQQFQQEGGLYFKSNVASQNQILKQRKGAPKEKQIPAQLFCLIGHGTAVGSEQDRPDEHTVGLQTAVCVINLTQLSAVSCCTVRLTLVCATGKQPAEILIETFRCHAAESFLST